jgi:hypothetical protein
MCRTRNFLKLPVQSVASELERELLALTPCVHDVSSEHPSIIILVLIFFSQLSTWYILNAVHMRIFHVHQSVSVYLIGKCVYFKINILNFSTIKYLLICGRFTDPRQRNSPFCNNLNRYISSFMLGPHTFFSTLFSNPSNICSFVKVTQIDIQLEIYGLHIMISLSWWKVHWKMLQNSNIICKQTVHLNNVYTSIS